MQLVASSKMQLFQRKALAARKYVMELLHTLEGDSTALLRTVYGEMRTKGATLFVLYTSDKGLCGPLNAQLMKRLFKSEKWLNTPADQRVLITIGRKAHDYTKMHKIPVAHHFKGLPEQLTTVKALDVIDSIIKYWTEDKVKEIIFVVSHYKNTFTTYPVLKTFLPFSAEMIHSHHIDLPPKDLKRKEEKLYEPSQERVIEALSLQILETIFLQSFFELKAAEYSSRMIAMQNSTEAAHKIINNLKLGYNKLRQQLITQELAELAGGADSEEE